MELSKIAERRLQGSIVVWPRLLHPTTPKLSLITNCCHNTFWVAKDLDQGMTLMTWHDHIQAYPSRDSRDGGVTKNCAAKVLQGLAP